MSSNRDKIIQNEFKSESKDVKDIKDQKVEQKPLSKPTQQEEKFSLLIKKLLDRLNTLSKPLHDGDNWDVEDFNDTPLFRALAGSEPVIKISHKIKQFGNMGLLPKGTIIHIENHHSTIQSIKLNEFMEPRTSTPQPKLVITLMTKQAERMEYYIKDSEIVKFANELRTVAAELNLAEFVMPKFKIKETDKRIAPLKAWETGWEVPNAHGLWYNIVNDPMILDQFQSRVLPLASDLNKDQMLVVLDAGAGKGRLAHKIISETLQNNIPIHYIVLEPTEQIILAQEKLKELSRDKRCKITFVKSTLLDFEAQEKAHCVISSGGPIDADIVSRQTALSHVKKIEDSLLPGGIFIATGQTGILVKAKHFNKAGLKVLSYATPCVTPKGYENHEFIKMATHVAGFFGHYQRYVCQKPGNKESKDQKDQNNQSKSTVVVDQTNTTTVVHSAPGGPGI